MYKINQIISHVRIKIYIYTIFALAHADCYVYNSDEYVGVVWTESFWSCWSSLFQMVEVKLTPFHQAYLMGHTAWKQAMVICGHRLSLQAQRVRLVEMQAHTNLLLDQFVGCYLCPRYSRRPNGGSLEPFSDYRIISACMSRSNSRDAIIHIPVHFINLKHSPPCVTWF